MSEENEIKKDNEVVELNKRKKKKLFENLFEKIKKIKHLDKILTILFIAIILLIYFSSFTSGTSHLDTEDKSVQLSENIGSTSLVLYQKELENKITSTISNIKDAGNVKVMVYFNKSIETIIAYTIKTEIGNNGVKVETKSPVLITKDGKSEPIILQEIMPEPASIIVVASGAINTSVKLEILRAVQTMFNFNSCNIEIFAGN